MTRRLWVAAALLLVMAGCGGGNDRVPDDAVAVVAGKPVPKSDYEAVIAQAREGYNTQKRPFPKAGSREFQTLRTQAVQVLVQREQFEQEARDFDIEVTDEQVDKRVEQIQKQYFGGDAKRYEQQLKEQGLTDKQVRADIRAQLVSERIFERVTRLVKVTDAEVATHYAKNKAQYSQPQSREVRHILVKTRAKADDLYDQLKGGADFSDLAKKFSEDTGSKANGGKLTISKGQTVAPFDQTAFLLKKNDISRPVKTEFGFHIIQPIGDVKEAKVTPLKEVESAIRGQLLQERKNAAMTSWVAKTTKEYENRTRYQKGFAPPAASTTSGTLRIETAP